MRPAFRVDRYHDGIGKGIGRFQCIIRSHGQIKWPSWPCSPGKDEHILWFESLRNLCNPFIINRISCDIYLKIPAAPDIQEEADDIACNNFYPRRAVPGWCCGNNDIVPI